MENGKPKMPVDNSAEIRAKSKIKMENPKAIFHFPFSVFR